jgi:HSP20 family protein
MRLPSVLDELDRLFDELIRRPWGATVRQLVPTEFREVKDGWIVELPVEGLEAADLQVEVQGRRLTVSGQHRRQQEGRHTAVGWSRTEDVSLHRTITLPPAADPDDIEAKIEGSTLTIHIRRRHP